MTGLYAAIAWLKDIFRSKPKLKLVPPVPMPAPIVKPELPAWIKIAQGELGIREVRGGENRRILEYHASTKLHAVEDEVPWCSAFVSWCLEKSGIPSTKSAWARSYLEWGVKLGKPQPYCVVVFRRGSNSGHVGFLSHIGTDYLEILGGNQGNSVCYAKYPKKDVLGYRWPS